MKQLLLIFLTIAWILASLAVRVIDLEKSPPSLNFDEAALGYNAYSLLLTGKDEYGTPWPISLRSFNDYKPALYSYLTIPFIYLFGLNQTTTRLVSAVFGTISLIFLLLIFKQLTKSTWAKSLLVVSVLSFLPWRLHFSRIAFESNLSMAFFTASVWCLINFHKNRVFPILLVLFSLLAVYSYHGARLAIPILLVLFFLDPAKFNWKNLTKTLSSLKQLWPLAIIALMYLPLFWANDTRSVLRRFSDTNVFSHYYPYAPKELVHASSVWLNFLAHPIYYLGGILTGHITSYFSPKNLSLSLYPWVIKSAQVISGSGMIGWLGGILIILGIWQWLNQIHLRKEYRLLLYWILAGLAPAAITKEWFHPLRSLNIYPAIELVIGLGLLWLFALIKNFPQKQLQYLFFAFLACVIVASSTYNILNELNYSIWDTHGEFQPGGYKEGASLLNSLKDKYRTVYIDSPHAQNYIIFLAYMRYPPENIQKVASTRPPAEAQGILNFNFDNFVYKKYSWPEDKKRNSFVYWTSSEVKEEEINATPGAKLYKIYDPFGRWVTSIITKD